MALNDCTIATSLEVTDPSMVISGMSFAPALTTQGGVQVSAIQAMWDLVTNPYITGVQFEYLPADGSASTVLDLQRSTLTTWMAFRGVLSGRSYSIRYRAAGAPGLFGPWSSPTTVSAGTVVSPAPAQPGSSAWSAVGTTTTANSVSFPAITLSGAVDTTGVTEVVVYLAPHGGSTFVPFGTYPANTISVLIDSVGSGAVVDIGIAYKNGETTGTMRVINNGGSGYTAGAFAGSGATTDVTPTAVDWTDQTASGAGAQTTTTNTQTISGINSPIVLTANYTNTASWSYIKNGAAPVGFSSGGNVTVVNGDTLAWRCTNSATVTSVLTIVNTTDSSTTLDTTQSALTVTSTDAHADAISVGNVSETSYGSSPCYGLFDQFTVTGINVPVTITLSRTGVASLAYSLNGAAYTSVGAGGSFTANNNDTVAIYGVVSGVGHYTGTLTITNTTDSSTVMAAPTYDLTVSAGPWP